MTRIIITRADEVLKTLPGKDIAAIVSVEHPGVAAGERGAAPRLDDVPQLILTFWDAEQKVTNGPDTEQVEQGIRFALEHLEKGDVLIHCHAGKSRSVAIALGVLALRHPDTKEEDLLEMLLEIRPIAAPNILIVEMVDDIAGRGGKLLAAVLAHPRITEQREQTEANRQALLKDRHDLFKKMNPEKFFKP